jgi:hypothetical protein
MAVLSQAIDKGIYFEVNISGLLKDPLARRHLISNVGQLVRATRGKNIIFSSGATSPLMLRAPYDLMNLGSIFGMEAALAKQALDDNPRSVAFHAGSLCSLHETLNYQTRLDGSRSMDSELAETRKTHKAVLQVTNLADIPTDERAWRVPHTADEARAASSSAKSQHKHKHHHGHKKHTDHTDDDAMDVDNVPKKKGL